MEITILNDVIIIFGLSIVVLFLFHKLKLPPIIGFLLTGILAGPFGLELVNSVHEVEILAEIGILLLLFTIGIEFSFQKMLSLRKSVLLGGTIQVVGTIVVILILANTFASSTGEAVFIGFLVALSSTAIVLKLYTERGEIDSPHGRTLLAMLIFQDIIVVPMMLLVPILAGKGGNLFVSIGLLLLKGALVVVCIYIATKYIVPYVLHQIAATRLREMFLLTIFVTCFGIVWLTASLGLSLALGAFLAGLIISESEYSHQAISNILPFRDAFTSLFFVSIGMLLDFNYLFDNILIVVAITLAIVILKTIIAGTAALSLGFPLRTAVIVGFGLGQVGEFSFILAKTGMDFGFLSGDLYQMFLAISIITMAATPFLIKLSPKLADMTRNLPLPKRFTKEYNIQDTIDTKLLSDHVIIIGYGITGRNISKAAKTADIPYIIIEMNPDTVAAEKAKGEPIFYGDAAYEEVLNHAKVSTARVVVVAINDPASARGIVRNVKEMNPNAYTIVRTRYLNEMEGLYRLNADEVIPEEFETSVEIFTRVMNKYLVPQNEIQRFIDGIRTSGYEMFRSMPGAHKFPGIKIHFPDHELCSLIVDKNSNVSGKTLAEIDLRRKHGVTILAINRGGEMISNPAGDTTLHPEDNLYVLAKHEKYPELASIFSGRS